MAIIASMVLVICTGPNSMIIQIQKMYNEVKANGRSKGPKKEKEPGLSSSTVRGCT